MTTTTRQDAHHLRLRRRFGLAATIVALLAACSPTRQPTEPELHIAAFGGPTMGTTFTALVVSEGELPAAERSEIAVAVQQTLDSVNASMSTYVEDSEVSRLNRALAGEPFAVSGEMLNLVGEAHRLSRLSGGALDITVGPLVNAYGFGPSEAAIVPDAEEVERLLSLTGYELLTIDAEASTLTKAEDDLYVDLSAIAKGYAVDRVAEQIAVRGHTDFMVEVGGEVRAHGVNRERQAWRIGVERPSPSAPNGKRPVQRILSLDGVAMATSGDYRNFRLVGGERLTHIVDPRNGASVHHRLASVTVLHDSCATADGLATALMVLGPEEALRFAEEHELAVLLLLRAPEGDDAEFEERASSAMSHLLTSSDT